MADARRCRAAFKLGRHDQRHRDAARAHARPVISACFRKRVCCGTGSPTRSGLSDGVAANVLNLFAYSGGATLAAARAGCSVCHVDSSKSMVTRARENAALNQLDAAPIRWIVEDVGKFLDREIRRGRKYDAIMLDPPSFGRGTRGEQYKIERDLALNAGTMSGTADRRAGVRPAHVAHPGCDEGATRGSDDRRAGRGDIASGEMELTGASDVRPVNDGVWTHWTR